jgi:hypothetical protein
VTKRFTDARCSKLGTTGNGERKSEYKEMEDEINEKNGNAL